jgi:hypothetical protein
MDQPIIKDTSALKLIKTVANVNQDKVQVEQKTPAKIEIHPSLASGLSKLSKCHLNTEENILLLEAKPKEAYIIASALEELKDEKLITDLREVFKKHPESALDIAKVLTLLQRHNLLTEDNLTTFKSNKKHLTEAYFVHEILKKLETLKKEEKPYLVTQGNFKAICENIQYATQICSLMNKLVSLDQTIFDKIMKFADNAGCIATRLTVNKTNHQEFFGDTNRFNLIIDELTYPITESAEATLESDSEIESPRLGR